MRGTDHVTVIRDLGQHVKSVQADQHLYLFINYNAKYPGGCGFDPRRGRQHSFLEIDHEIFSMFIFSLLLIQEGLLSVSGERMCTILVNRLED